MPTDKPIRGATPRFRGSAGKLRRRGPFLDGSERCYYGPGQAGDVDMDASDYMAHLLPSDWPKAGSLLHCPQVVWLSVQLPARLYTTGGPDPAYGSEAAWGGWEAYSIDTGKCHYIEIAAGRTPEDNDFILGFDITAGYPAVWDQIHPVAVEVKSRIDAIREGRTWVYLAPWNLPATTTDAGWYAGFQPFPCPPESEAESDSPWFGTNFHAAYLGHVCWQEDLGGLPGLARNYDLTPETAGSPIDRPSYAAAKARLSAAFPHFARYSADLYGYASVEVQKQEFVGGEFLPQLDTIGPQNTRLMQAMAADLADLGVSYRADFPAVTADDIVGTIAGRFGFDPETGRDLPPDG